MKKNLKYLIFSHSSFTFQKVRMKNNNTELKNKNKKNIFYTFKLTRLNNTENVSYI
jgi:hypothetical protein